ncbi:MAG: hypothetical protein U5L10_02335 [Candidatus Moranbacteria bacterium]|nr:hypothetical protein [Candidatus Moranbacteria bacterium]
MSKKNLYLILGIILLFSSSLFYYQETKQRERAGSEYTVMAFLNANSQYDKQKDENSDVFSFFIENSSPEKTEYAVEFKSREKSLGVKKIEVQPKSSKTINLGEEAVKELANSEEDVIRFAIDISWKDKERTIYKKIRLK